MTDPNVPNDRRSSPPQPWMGWQTNPPPPPPSDRGPEHPYLPMPQAPQPGAHRGPAQHPAQYLFSTPPPPPPPPGQWLTVPPHLSPSGPSRAARVFALGVSLLIVFVVGFASGGAFTESATPNTPTGSISPGATMPPGVPSDFGVFFEALKLVQDRFVDPSKTTDQNLTWGAIRGMVDALGDTGHSIFLTPDQVNAENNSLNGHVSGIGVVVDSRSSPPTVISVISGSPAEAAGIKAGDVILAVDGTSTETLQPNDVVSKIRGEAGTSVTLTVRHTGDTGSTDIKIVRADVVVPAASWAMVPGTTVADLKIEQFSNGSGDAVKADLQEALKAGATKIVLDLRGNPGGYVSDAITVASQFLASGVVYEERDRAGTTAPHNAESGGLATSIPLVVLIDGGSASAAEIVAGAIQGNHRAELVGEQTFGTGTVLNTFTLSDGSALRLGVLEWLTPSGETIFGKGITPDVEVSLPANGQLVDPGALKTMSATELAGSTDTQLQRALQVLAAQPAG